MASLVLQHSRRCVHQGCTLTRRLVPVSSLSTLPLSNDSNKQNERLLRRRWISSNSASLPTTTATPAAAVRSTTTNPQGRLAKSLYRQLLRWCQDTGSDFPLSSFVPPVTLHAPTSIDEQMLQSLLFQQADDDSIMKLLPSNAKIAPTFLTVPIHTARDAMLFFKAIYRMNRYHHYHVDQNNNNIDQHQKQRVTWAFQAMKSLNELTDSINEMKAQAELHKNREGVKFNVGQVVQHKKERWRGVIVGWDHQDDRTIPTSLTLKEYTRDATKENIQYTLNIDSGDQKGFQLESDAAVVVDQGDLVPVQDVSICRIQNRWNRRQFERFDAINNAFVPNDALAFAFPNDITSIQRIHTYTTSADRTNELGRKIVAATQDIASRLHKSILSINPSAKKDKSSLVASLEESLSNLSIGNVLSNEEQFARQRPSDHALAILHLRSLHKITMDTFGMLWQRRIAHAHVDTIQFKLGDIVVHTKYGFRGIVIAWDPKPKVDVSHWDGLQHIDNPNDEPFYHIIPDQSDCVKIFGGERPFRYVCQQNLERCPRSRTNIDVDITAHDGWEEDKVGARYTAPDIEKFKFGEGIGDDGVTDKCFEIFDDEITKLHIALQYHAPISHGIKGELSMDDLYEILHHCDSMESCRIVEDTIKEIWKANEDRKIRKRLDDGISELFRGDSQGALLIFLDIVKDDPTYAEAWNKLSTCQFLLDDMQSSLDSANKTLELIPNHFQALNGLGLIQYETRRYKLAAESFRRSLHLNPWSPVSTKLSACIDLQSELDLEEETWSQDGEQGAEEGTAPYH